MNVLSEKRQALLRERRQIAEHLDEAREEWGLAAREAAVWLDRATVLSGARRLRLAAFYRGGEATVDLRWRNSLGVKHPVEAHVSLPPEADLSRLGSSTALIHAARTHRRAVEAAARFAALQLAFDSVSFELAATIRRLRAIERRWIPAHEAALAALAIALDEAEREDAARVRWALDRQARP